MQDLKPLLWYHGAGSWMCWVFFFFFFAMMQLADPRGQWKDAITVKWERLGKGGSKPRGCGLLGRTVCRGTGGSVLLAPRISGVKGINGACESGCAGSRTRPAQTDTFSGKGGILGRLFLGGSAEGP